MPIIIVVINTIEKEIAYKDDMVVQEKLPLPIVYYPGFYGAFFGFSEIGSSDIFFCSCNYEAIINYIKIRDKEPHFPNPKPIWSYILSSSHFPKRVIADLLSKKIKSNKKVINHIQFFDRICHECNKAVPSMRYCHQHYGGVFKQNYGWYIIKQAFEWGIKPISYEVLNELCPQEIIDMIHIDPLSYKSEYQRLNSIDFMKAYEFQKSYDKQKRKIWNVIENEVRMKFGQKKIGEAWTSETILYYIVKSLFPNMTIKRHYRPKFLEGLELDIFIEEKNIGIEYQGIQHYKPIKHWGGEESLSKVKHRDEQKRRIMEELDFPLVYFNYDEGLNDTIVLERLSQLL